MAYHFAQSEFLSRRALAAGAIIALHAGAAYLLATGLIHTIVADESPRLKVLVDITRPALPVVPPVAARLQWTRPTIDRPPLPPSPIVTTGPPPDPGAVEGSTAQPVDLTGPPATEDLRVLGKNQLPATEDYYPPAKRRDGVEGASDVRVCVDAQGVRQGEPLLEHSSGDADLDNGALTIARHGRFARTWRGNQPVPNCYHFRITFKIK